MNSIKKILKDFRDLKITRIELFSQLVDENKDNDGFVIYNKDLIFVLNQYIEKKITQEKLLDWVNTIAFSDLYERNEDESDSLGFVLYELEELDERTEPLSNEEALYYINALTKNIEAGFFIPTNSDHQ